MTIYGRFHDPVVLLRLATIEDVQPLEGRSPDDRDRQAVEGGSYVVVRQDDGRKCLYHQAFLRADDGSREIAAAIEALAPAATPDASGTHAWTQEEFRALATGDVVEHLSVLASGRAWTPYTVEGRSRGGSRVHVSHTRPDGSVVGLALTIADCRRSLRLVRRGVGS